MTNVVELAKYRKAKEPQPPVAQPPQVVAAAMVVEDMRATLYALPNNQARMELCFMLLTVLTQWIVHSKHYDNPEKMVTTWIARKLEHFARKEG